MPVRDDEGRLRPLGRTSRQTAPLHGPSLPDPGDVSAGGPADRDERDGLALVLPARVVWNRGGTVPPRDPNDLERFRGRRGWPRPRLPAGLLDLPGQRQIRAQRNASRRLALRGPRGVLAKRDSSGADDAYGRHRADVSRPLDGRPLRGRHGRLSRRALLATPGRALAPRSALDPDRGNGRSHAPGLSHGVRAGRIPRGVGPARGVLLAAFAGRASPGVGGSPGIYLGVNFGWTFLAAVLAMSIFLAGRRISRRGKAAESLLPLFIVASAFTGVAWLLLFRQGSYIHVYWQLWLALPVSALVAAFITSLGGRRRMQVLAGLFTLVLCLHLRRLSAESYDDILRVQLGTKEDIEFLKSLRQDRFNRMVFVPLTEDPLNEWFQGPLFEYYTDRPVVSGSEKTPPKSGRSCSCSGARSVFLCSPSSRAASDCGSRTKPHGGSARTTSRSADLQSPSWNRRISGAASGAAGAAPRRARRCFTMATA